MLVQQAKDKGYRLRFINNTKIGIHPWSKLTEEDKKWFLENKQKIIRELRKLKAEELKKIFDENIARGPGMGTHLEIIIKFLIPKKYLNQIKECKCNDYKKNMDGWGTKGCIIRKKIILDNLVNQSQQIKEFRKVPKKYRRFVALLMFNLSMYITKTRLLFNDK